MRFSKYIKISLLLALGGAVGCTKLTESYNSTIASSDAVKALGTTGLQFLVNAAYLDVKDPFISDQAKVFEMQEICTDEVVVATRGGDWDDNGQWRAMHQRAWNADHVSVSSTFNALNKLQFDATNVLNFQPSAEIAAEARFLRAYSLYTLLDLYGQYPFRNPGDTLLNAPPVKSGPAAIQFIIDELTAIIPVLNPANPKNQATPDAARFLLMECYLNRGAFNNRQNPTFDDADMVNVIQLGQTIMGNGYHYIPNYFGNFNPQTSGSSPELIWGMAPTGNVNTNPRADTRYCMTFHYNEWTGAAPGAGWNGFSTTADFYASFSTAGSPAIAFSPADTLLDTRLGGRKKSDSACTALSGIRPGFMLGQQYAADGTPLKDRNGSPLAYTAGGIPDNLYILTAPAQDVAGIRVDKYVPDFVTGSSVGQNYSNTPQDWMAWFRYPAVVLMVAEAKMRSTSMADAAGALTLVNELRAARGAAPLGTMTLGASDGTSAAYANSLLAERGRELYWESFRRTDLIRFGVFLTTWFGNTTTDATYLLFPIPNQALGVNPNLKQNPGYN
jgi:hypothetical protein